MIKRLLSAALVLVSAFMAGAQAPQMQPLPLNPDVKHGTLPNGMQYFILHNELPKERANFYIAQKVGSTLETEDQLGLAHFLEHMAFNGTKNYPGKNMLNYLQSKGIRFGADINAYTAFDETVYNIDNVPTTDKALMDSVLLVLHDWSGSILLEESEINAERGVIEEEWRMRSDAMNRMYIDILPKIYKEYQYQQMPIGKMEIVRNFPPEALRAYYKKWYRPDQQGIVIVGDLDAAEMEKKVIDLFSKIPMPENAAERTYPSVSDNKEPIYAFFQDSELQFPMAMVAFKFEKIPFEMRNTLPGYLQDNVIFRVLSRLINNRLNEYKQNPECKYASAAIYFGDFFVSKTKGAVNIRVIGKDEIKEALAEAMGIIARACKTGFTDSELERVRSQMLSEYENMFNERNNTRSGNLANELIRHFVDNEPAPGIEEEYKLMQQYLPAFPVEAFNESAKQLLTQENQVIVVSQPQKDGAIQLTSEEIVPIVNNALTAEYEAYVDEVITEPLIAKLPKPGKITEETAGKFDTKEFKLSNGVKVIVKPTDFKADEVRMIAFKEGGKRSYAASEAANVLLAGDAFSLSKFGNFDTKTLRKYLAGKNASVSYSIGAVLNRLSGSSTAKDLPVLMELVYTAFTNLNPDQQTYQAQIDQAKTFYANQDKDPMEVFKRKLAATRYGDNPMFMPETLATLEAANYPEMLEMVKKSLSNAADYTFVFVGNVDMDTFKPLVEQYLATLPSTGKKEVLKNLTSINQVKGQKVCDFKQPMKTPSTMILDIYSGYNIPYNIDNDVKMSLLGSILGNIYTETLREEEGGTYSPAATAYMDSETGVWNILYQVQTNAAMQQKLMDRAHDELMKLLQNGATEEQFKKVKEAEMKQYEINVRKNGYWLNNLLSYARGIDDISGHKAAIENITLADFNKFMKNLYNGDNRIQVIMEGVEESK